jgi:hypothetical protein
MLKRLFSRKTFTTPVSVRVDDSPGWTSTTGRPHDRDYGEIQEQYTDTLLAWRKNPIAWRIISITTDYVIGKDFSITSPFKPLDNFIKEFWNHPKNRMDLRLTGMCDELSRSGDLFVLLWRNPIDGMSYLRFLTKDQIRGIKSAPTDWETEISYEVGADLCVSPPQSDPIVYLSPDAEGSMESQAICLHYAVNRPIGALMGESDLTTMIPWLLRYSRMLEDRVRLHWAARAFLYLVTVPSNKIETKSNQYQTQPESGSIIVKDESEKWETLTPSLRGADASHDMKSVRNMIDAGSGYPPHWRGEGGDVNVATAEAMQGPPEKHLARRQQYFIFILQDVIFNAYNRAASLRKLPPLPTTNYEKLFKINAPDVSSRDNGMLANSATGIAHAMQQLESLLQGNTNDEFKRLVTDLVLTFAGEIPEERDLDKLIKQPPPPAPIITPKPTTPETRESDQGKPLLPKEPTKPNPTPR